MCDATTHAIERGALRQRWRRAATSEARIEAQRVKRDVDAACERPRKRRAQAPAWDASAAFAAHADDDDVHNNDNDDGDDDDDDDNDNDIDGALEAAVISSGTALSAVELARRTNLTTTTTTRRRLRALCKVGRLRRVVARGDDAAELVVASIELSFSSLSCFLFVCLFCLACEV